MKEGGVGITDEPCSYDEGRGLQMRASMHRRRAGRVGGGRCTSVGRGTRRWGPACMGGGWHTWEEGGAHGRRAVHMGGGRCTWEEGGMHERRVAHMGGGWCILVGAI